MSKNDIEYKINTISINTGCEVSKSTGNFDMTFDLRNFDYQIYTFQFQDSSIQFNGICHILAGTSEKPSYFSGNTPVQNRYSIICKYPLESSIPKFTIYESGLFQKILHKKHISIKCTDKHFLDFLIKSPEVIFLEERIRNSSSVSPSIVCKKEKDYIVLHVNFHSHEEELKLYEKMILLCKKIKN